MPKLDFNLASRPLRNDRLYFLICGVFGLLLFLFTSYNLWTYLDNTLLARRLTKEIERNEVGISEVRDVFEDPQRRLSRRQEKKARELCGFVNTIIARRNFSWTLLFNELERITPRGVRVTSISPTIRERSIGLMLNCIGKNLEDDVLGFVNNLNHSRSFSRAFIGGETKEGGGRITFPLTVEYHPDVARLLLTGEREPAGEQ